MAKRIIGTTPKQDGYRMPAEFEPQQLSLIHILSQSILSMRVKRLSSVREKSESMLVPSVTDSAGKS